MPTGWMEAVISLSGGSAPRAGVPGDRASGSPTGTFAVAGGTSGPAWPAGQRGGWYRKHHRGSERGGHDGCRAGVSGAGGRVAGRAVVSLAVAGQMGAGDSALHRAGVLVGRVRRAERGGDGGDRGHRPLPAGHLRVQRGGAAVDLAGAVLRDRRVRHRPVPAVHAGRRPLIPRSPGDRVPGAAVPRAGAGEMVAAGHPAVHHRRRVHRVGIVGRVAARRATTAGGAVPG